MKKIPLTTGELDNFVVVIEAPITSLTRESIKDVGLDNKAMNRSKNMFALGMVFWMFSRPLEYTESFFKKKFAKKPLVIEANIKALRSGFHFAETLELFSSAYTILPAKMKAGTYRIISGNTATAWGLMAAAEKAGRSSYFWVPIPLHLLRIFCMNCPNTKYLMPKPFRRKMRSQG
jgi:2-oxoglutarate ferredoxin oxidoreductase subunit alpha